MLRVYNPFIFNSGNNPTLSTLAPEKKNVQREKIRVRGKRESKINMLQFDYPNPIEINNI